MTEVRLETGVLRGEQRDGVRVFKGVPYAAPPVGELRFAAPGPVAPWQGVRDATRFAGPAPQIDIMTGRLAGDEDCLHVNVYAPATPGPHPVFVWIHGGGGLTGTPNDYDGTLFARDGVVVVTIAYRLGVLGLLQLPGVFDTNLALLDQVAALAWVRDNIEAFGGEPARVTVAGESNGGRTVATLLATPSADGLFQQAIVQSGTGAGYAVMTPEQAAGIAEAVLAEAGLNVATAAGLRDLPVPEIVAAQTRVTAAASIRVPFQAVVDGSVLPGRPIDLVDGRVRLLVGTNHDEQDLFWRLPGAGGAAGTESMVVTADRLAEATAAYRELLPGWSDGEVQRHAMTSSEWWIPAIRLAEAQHRAGGEVWMYRLDWRLSPRGKGMGAMHALELPFVFGRAESPWMRALFGSADPGRVESITAAMHSAWVRFVTNGDPGWPRYQPPGRTTYLFDDTCTVAEDPDRDLRQVWQDLI